MPVNPASFLDADPIITKASPSDFAHVVGPNLGVGNELRINLNPPPVRPLAIGGGRKSRKHGRKSRKHGRKSRKHGGMYHKRGGMYHKHGGKTRKQSKHGYKNCGNNSKLMKKYHKDCKKSVVASCCRRFRKNNKPYLKGGNGGNIIDSAVYGIDPTIDTVSGALATPTPVSRMNACVV